MKIIASFTSSVAVSQVLLTDLSGVERKCAVCHQPFDHDDVVVALAKSTYDDVKREVPLSQEELFLVHLKGKEQGSCLEDFVATLLAPKETPQPAG